MDTSTRPERIAYHTQSRVLELQYSDGKTFDLPAEYLRVYSPSAEVRGHGGQGATLQTGKRNVAIEGIEPSGNYAIKIRFDDGHDSGLFSWAYLSELGDNQTSYWTTYLDQLEQASASRDPNLSVVKIQDKPGCGR